MADSDYMPKVNIEKESHKLSSIEKEYMQRVHEQNLARVQRWSKIRTKNRVLGSALGIGVMSIYFYSMWAIKQESFLDDFNEPEKIEG